MSTLEVLYLFGGWDGSKSLADLWQYNISSAQWHQISADTSSEVRDVMYVNTLSILL